MGRRSWLALCLAVGLVACTSTPGPSPSPSPTTPVAGSPGTSEPVGLRVAVVLPPGGGAPLTAAGTRTAADAVAARKGDAIGEFRTVSAGEDEFVGDVATLLAERGYDLVCVVGDDAAEVALTIAPTFPATRFCAVPAATSGEGEDLPENVLVVDVRLEEAAYLAGVAAAAPRPQDASSPDDDETPAAVAALVGDSSWPQTARQRAAFVAGLRSVLGGSVTPQVDVTATTAEELAESAAEQFDAGVPVVFVPGGPSDAGVIEEAAVHDGLVVVLRDRARFQGETPEEVLVWFLVDVGVALRVAVAQALDGWEGGRATVGLTEDAIRLQSGGHPDSAVVLTRVQEAAGTLRDGSTVVPGP